MEKPFVHLHAHSEYSLLKASARISAMIEKAKQFGMPGFAITDLGNMFCALDFYQSMKKADLKPVIGFEALMVEGSRHDKKAFPPKPLYSFMLYAKNYDGYRNLLKICSLGWIEGFLNDSPRVDQELLEQYHSDIIMVIAQKKGYVNALLKDGRRGEAVTYLKHMHDLMGEGNLYLEIVNHKLEEDVEQNRIYRELSQETGVPLVAANDSYYIDPSDSESHEILMAIAEKRTITDPDRPVFINREFDFKSPEQMYDLLAGYEDALENTLKIFDACNLELKFGEFHLPRYPIPEGHNEDTYLRSICEEGLGFRYGEFEYDILWKSLEPEDAEQYPTPESRHDFVKTKLRERMDFELDVIKNMGYSAYFLIVADFIKAGKRDGVPIGPGRGSAAGSLVAYLTEITNICPLRYGLFFERFLNPDRISMPDIDIDFCERRREEVIDYVKDFYGAEKVAQIITYGRLKTKAVLKDVARVLEVPFRESLDMTKSVPGDAKNLVQALEMSPELRRWEDQYPKLFEVAKKLEGVTRQTGIHAAGVIIAPDDVSDFVPLAGYGKSISTQYDGNVLESQGLLKMDFLGLSTLTMINDAVSHIKKNRGIDVNIDEIPLDDPEVFKILSNAWTAGLFQVDSELFQGILRRMQPDRFEDIIALVALGRPGPLGMGMDKVYCESRHDPEKISYPHELLQELLQETYGVILYQEQVMNTAVILAGYRMAEADDLRKVMGKKIAAKLPAHREKFVKGARELHQIDEKISDGIFDLMATFAEYGFNKSHSACYGLVCYQTCWLKAHYPQEFMAASLSDKIDSQEAVAYRIADCNRMKIPILPPSVNGSEFYFSVEGDAVRFGMGAVKEVGSRAIECIIQARDEGGEFKSLRDFCYRVDLFAVNKKVIENLIKVGAFDELPGNRKQKLAIYEGCYQEGQEYQKNRRAGQKSLFEIKGTPQIQADKFNEELECSPVEQLAWEKELTGIYFSGHPLEPYRFYLEKATSHRVGEVEELANKTKILAAGMVSNFRRKISKKGEDYIQFVLTDFESSVDCVVFPRQFKRVTFKVLNDQIVILSGSKSVQMFNNRTQLIVDDMELIPALHESARWKMALSLFLTPSDANSESLGQLKELIEKHCGKKDFRLRYRSGGYDVSLKLPGNTGVSGDRDCIHDIGRVFGFEKMFLNVTPPVFTR